MERARGTTPAYNGSTYTVEGLTNGVCIAEVMEAVRRLPHLTDVAVDLVANGRSSLIVHSDGALPAEAVLECVARAGFRASPTGKRRARHLQRTFTGRAQALHPGAET